MGLFGCLLKLENRNGNGFSFPITLFILLQFCSICCKTATNAAAKSLAGKVATLSCNFVANVASCSFRWKTAAKKNIIQEMKMHFPTLKTNQTTPYKAKLGVWIQFGFISIVVACHVQRVWWNLPLNSLIRLPCRGLKDRRELLSDVTHLNRPSPHESRTEHMPLTSLGLSDLL